MARIPPQHAIGYPDEVLWLALSQRLDVSGNKLGSLDELKHLQCAKRLTHLDLYNNPWEAVSMRPQCPRAHCGCRVDQLCCHAVPMPRCDLALRYPTGPRLCGVRA